MNKLLIFPYNGNGLEALSCVGNHFEVIGFIDDTKEKQGKQPNGYHVYSREVISKYPEAKILAVPGSPTSFRERKKIIEGLKIPVEKFATVIHPSASVSPLVKIGYNVLLMAGTVITTNAVIGNHICVLPNTVIHHDVELADWTLIGSNVTIAGYVKVGSNCYIGSGTSIINNITVGENSLIGMGTNVIRSVPPGSKVVGNPARQIQ